MESCFVGSVGFSFDLWLLSNSFLCVGLFVYYYVQKWYCVSCKLFTAGSSSTVASAYYTYIINLLFPVVHFPNCRCLYYSVYLYFLLLHLSDLCRYGFRSCMVSLLCSEFMKIPRTSPKKQATTKRKKKKKKLLCCFNCAFYCLLQ